MTKYWTARPAPMQQTDPVSQVRTSKSLSLVLRHRTDTIGLALDSAGWIRIDQLLEP
jgi:RNA:NAD 2'-phosphotransferase (TPT1/KptA family)